jgi:hypothetical protein
MTHAGKGKIMAGNRKYGFRRGNGGGFSNKWFCSGCGKTHAVNVCIELELGAKRYCGKSKTSKEQRANN